MAILVEAHNTSILTPDEILDWAIKNVDPEDEAGMLAAAPLLYSLYNNRRFVAESVHAELLAVANGRPGLQKSPQAFGHGHRSDGSTHFSIRTVSWTPALTNNERSQAVQDRTFSYTAAHDHNFSLLTIGYCGPGYETYIHEYDDCSVVGFAGEEVELRSLGSVTLSEAKLMYYRPKKDVHSQRYPKDISISLNLIGESPRINSLPQYEFDVERCQIVGLLDQNTVMRQLVPFELAEAIGVDDETLDLMIYMARVHPSGHVRARALQAVYYLRPSMKEEVYSMALRDRAPIVKKFALESTKSG
jgi:hypothetical protein